MTSDFGFVFFKLTRTLGLKQAGYSNIYVQYIPDRYFTNLNLYKKTANFYNSSDLKAWNKGTYINNAGDHTRFYFLNLCIDFVLEENIPGDIAELGVYKGNSAYLLARLARKKNSTLYLFDTFEGFDSKDLVDSDSKYSTQLFADTSLDAVRQLVGETNVKYIKGYFPETLNQMNAAPSFCIAHIDCDLEKPMQDALEYFYPRMVKGGFIIVHDHTSLYWEGGIKAINNFFKDKPEFLVPIPDKSGTSVIRKI